MSFPRLSLSSLRHLMRAVLIVAAGAAIAGCKEGRDAYAITDSGSLIKFQTDKPESLDNTMTITGLADGESILQIDFRAEDEVLYGLTSNNRIATIDTDNGVATLVSATPFETSPGVSGQLNQPVMDINPQQDLIRVIDYQPTSSGTPTSILRINPVTGALDQSDGSMLRFNDSDTNDGEVVQLAAIAHTNNDKDATTTTLYGLEFNTQSLVRITNAGVLTTVGVLDRGFVAIAGFDVVRERGDKPEDIGTAYVAIAERNNTSRFYEINLTDGNTSGTGSGTNGSEIGSGLQIRSLAVSPKPPKRNGLGN
ncbi:DUF4394 domain-containing protein [Nevskia sp.]|uniref:DUF4394 domain-containing protein n=1 Tax=Nevskia sp. TaxID=1929292 RepID=UPI0025D78D40|nr:DUF4394 domain-containing protein [Nevskia sp.]